LSGNAWWIGREGGAEVGVERRPGGDMTGPTEIRQPGEVREVDGTFSTWAWVDGKYGWVEEIPPVEKPDILSEPGPPPTPQSAPGGAGASTAADAVPVHGPLRAFDNAGATRETRDTAKWIVATLGVIAGVVFGAGPIVSRPELSWSDDLPQLLAALLMGSIGLTSVILLILLVSEVLQPRTVDLRQIRGDFKKTVEADPDYYLPSDSDSLGAFRDNLRANRALIKGLSDQRRRAEQQSNGETTGQRSKKTEYIDRQLVTARENRGAYLRTRERLLDEARFHDVGFLLDRLKPGIFWVALAAAVGALVFQLALADADEAGAASDETGATGEGDGTGNGGGRGGGTDGVGQFPPNSPEDGGRYGYIPPADNAAQRTLWANLGLDPCAIGDGTVPVRVVYGNGSNDYPWRVVTLSLDRAECKPLIFDLRAQVCPLRLPEPSPPSPTPEKSPIVEPPPGTPTEGALPPEIPQEPDRNTPTTPPSGPAPAQPAPEQPPPSS
jgi:hypothetical protein